MQGAVLTASYQLISALSKNSVFRKQFRVLPISLFSNFKLLASFTMFFGETLACNSKTMHSVPLKTLG